MGTNHPRKPPRRRPTIAEAGGVAAWLNARLLPYLGPPPLGPVDTESAASKRARAEAGACPLCGRRMLDHDIDRSGERTQLYCPV